MLSTLNRSKIGFILALAQTEECPAAQGSLICAVSISIYDIYTLYRYVYIVHTLSIFQHRVEYYTDVK